LGLLKGGGEPGVLLHNLKGEQLEKAKTFCEAMNKVGLKPGDIDEVAQNTKF